jgi:hypothetical protein
VSIEVEDRDDILNYDEIEKLIMPIEEAYIYNECISLPHCPMFTEKVENGRLVRLVGTKDTKQKLVNRCETNNILIIKYRGHGNFSGGGNDVVTYLLTVDQKVTITKAFNRDEILYKFDVYGRNKFKLYNVEKKENKLEIEYKIKMSDTDSIFIIESHSITVSKDVKILIDNHNILCI